MFFFVSVALPPFFIALLSLPALHNIIWMYYRQTSTQKNGVILFFYG